MRRGGHRAIASKDLPGNKRRVHSFLEQRTAVRRWSHLTRRGFHRESNAFCRWIGGRAWLRPVMRSVGSRCWLRVVRTSFGRSKFLFQGPDAILGVGQVLLLKSRTNVYEMSAKVSHLHALLMSLTLGNVHRCAICMQNA